MAREVNKNTQTATPPLGKASAPRTSGSTQPGPKGTPPQPKGKTTGYP